MSFQKEKNELKNLVKVYSENLPYYLEVDCRIKLNTFKKRNP